jgi:hypothetical protein
MSKPIIKASPQQGVVTFLDVLGWKGVYDRQTNAVAGLKRLVDGVSKRAVGMRGRISNDVVVKSISDTIAIFTVCTDEEISEAIEIHGELCQWLIPESIQSELPIRGATACGDFEISESIFVGRAVDEAASWHEQGNWIGVNLSPSADFVFAPKGQSVWSAYAVPIKTSMKWKPRCVNWLTGWKDVDRESKSVRDKFRRMGPILPEIAAKFINTLAFIEEMKPQLPTAEPLQ